MCRSDLKKRCQHDFSESESSSMASPFRTAPKLLTRLVLLAIGCGA
jgi:hypothetical protein